MPFGIIFVFIMLFMKLALFAYNFDICLSLKAIPFHQTSSFREKFYVFFQDPDCFVMSKMSHYVINKGNFNLK